MANSKIWRNVGVAVIALPMLFYGANTFDTDATGGIALKVGDRALTMAELDSQIERSFRSLAPSVQQHPDVRQQLAGQLLLRNIRTFLLLEFSDEIGLQALPEEIEDWVRNNPEFQVDGVYSPELFASSVGDASAYLQQLGKELSEDKITQTIFNSDLALPELYLPLARYYAQSRIVSRIKIPVVEIDESQITDARLSAHFQQYLNDYVQPEQARFEYVLFDPDSYGEQVQLDEGDLRESYERRRAEATAAAERQLSMILLGSEEEATEVVALLENASFADMARERSLDAGSAEAGGGLGLLAREDLDEEIADAVFAAEIGDVVGPFDLGGDWALFKVAGQIGHSDIAFDDLRDDLLDNLRKERAQVLLEDDAYSIAEAVAVKEITLAEAAQDAGIEVSKSDWLVFNQGVGQFSYPFDDQAVVRDVITENLLENGETSPLMRHRDGVYVLARAIEHKPETQLSLEEAYDDVREDLIKVTKVHSMLSKLDESLVKLKKGELVPELDFSKAVPFEISSFGELPEGVTENHREEIFSFELQGSDTPPFISAFISPASEVMTLYRIEEIVEGKHDENGPALLARLQSPLQAKLQLLGYLAELESMYGLELNEEFDLQAEDQASDST